MQKRIDDNFGHLSTVCGNLSAKMQDLVADVDDKYTKCCTQLSQRLDSVSEKAEKRALSEHQHFTDVCANLDKKATDGIGQLGGQLTEKTGVLTGRVDDMVQALDRQHEHFSDVCSAMDRKQTGLSSQQADQIDSLSAQFDSMNTRLKRDIVEMEQAVNGKLNQKLQEQEQRQLDLANAMESRTQQLDARLDGTDQKLDASCSAQDSLIDDHHSYFTTCLNKLDRTVSEADKAVHERLDGEHKHFEVLASSLEKSLSEELIEVDRRSRQAVEALTRQVETSKEAVERRIDNEHAVLREGAVKVERKFEGLVSDVRKGLASAISDQAATASQFADALQQLQSSVEVANRSLTAQIADRSTALDAKLTETCGSLKRQVSAMDVALRAELAERSTAVGGELRQLITAVSDRQSRGEESLADQCAQLELALKKTAAELGGKQSEVATELQERLAVLSNQHVQEQAEARTELSGTQSSVRDLRAQVQSSAERLTGEMQALQQKLSADVSTQVSSLDAQVERRLMELQGRVDSKMQGSFEQLSTQLGDVETRVSAAEPRLDSTERSAQRANNAIEEMKVRVTLDSQDLRSGVEQGMKELNAGMEEMNEIVSEVRQMSDIDSILAGAAAASRV